MSSQLVTDIIKDYGNLRNRCLENPSLAYYPAYPNGNPALIMAINNYNVEMSVSEPTPTILCKLTSKKNFKSTLMLWSKNYSY